MIHTFVSKRLTRVERMIDFSGSLDLIVTLAIALHNIRRRSQVAKAADCKSAIAGSTPTDASYKDTVFTVSFFFCLWRNPPFRGSLARFLSHEASEVA